MNEKQNDPLAAMTDSEREARLLSTAGFARRAGRMVMGTTLLCEAIRDRKVCLVIEASDTSDNTHKRISDKATYYRVPHLRLSTVTAEKLGAAFGKSGPLGVIGITDAGFVRACEKYLPVPFGGQ